jgi:single-stranded-DNA-specific exonuclease
MPRTLIRRKTGPVSGSKAPPLLDRLFSGRSVTDVSELDHRLAGLIPPNDMLGLPAAASRLQRALTSQQQILIVGDFDADGATSSALMVLVLRAMGAAHVNYLVPNRFDYGYGLSPEIVEVARQFSPDLIVTVDNGISSIEGVALARRLGIDVLITDHHLPGDELPDATAIVNPNQAGCPFNSKSLAGVGVAFYLLSALRQRLRGENWFVAQRIKEPRLSDYLDIVALGTIADVVPLDRNNRILVSEGVKRIRAGRCRPGISALIRCAGTDPAYVTARDLAFTVGPRLNAVGRLQDMSLGIECLLAQGEQAEILATQLDEVNTDRKEIELEMKGQAEDALRSEVDSSRVGVCLHHIDWHEGVVGIIASRIKDQIHRPVIAFASTNSQDLKGSGRSIPGFHLRDALDAIATRNPGMLSKFGGHAMAAGLSLPVSSLSRFTEEFDAEARRWLTDEDLDNVLVSDGEITDKLDLNLALGVIEAAPWGQGFPEPVFDGMFEVIEQRIVGGRHLKLKLQPEGSQQQFDGIAFNQSFLIEKRRLRLAYRLDINRYKGMSRVQLIVECTDLKLP